jgi:hypothetical protein
MPLSGMASGCCCEAYLAEPDDGVALEPELPVLPEVPDDPLEPEVPAVPLLPDEDMPLLLEPA